MTDFQILDHLIDIMNLFYVGFSSMAAIVFAYITAAYFFLSKAPLVVKLGSFGFFLVSMVFLMVNGYGTYLHYLALIDQIELAAQAPDASFMLVETYKGQMKPLSFIGSVTFLTSIAGVLLMAFWMTFIWKPERSK